MKSFEHTVTDEMGLHARPVGLMVKKAGQYQSKITLKYDGKEVVCNRVIAIMKLGVKKDTVISFEIEGPDEEAAYEDFRQFCAENI